MSSENTRNPYALWRLSFRPFFLLGSLLAIIAVLLWIGALHGGGLGVMPQGGWLSWHQHELVFGFSGAIIVGFLLTAVKTWTNQPGFDGMPLTLLTLLWIVGRIGWFLPIPVWLLAGLNLLFFLVAAALMARTLWAVRQSLNYPTALLLLLLMAADGLYFYGVEAGDYLLQLQGIHAALWLVAGMITLIGGRVIPFFTQRGLAQEQGATPWPWLDIALLIGSLLVAGTYALGLAVAPTAWVGGLFALLGLGHAIRIVRWFDRRLLAVPLLWSLYLAYLWLIIACAMMACWHLGLLLSLTLAVHALTVGAIGGIILAMLARVTLGHTGRPLTLPRGFVVAFILLNIAALVRVLGVQVAYMPALGLAALCWSLAFAQYLWVYGPMLLRPRVDGKPG